MTPDLVPPTRLAVIAGWVTLAVIVLALVAGGVKLARNGFDSSPGTSVSTSTSGGHLR
jgi:hypothetical protein